MTVEHRNSQGERLQTTQTPNEQYAILVDNDYISGGFVGERTPLLSLLNVLETSGDNLPGRTHAESIKLVDSALDAQRRAAQNLKKLRKREVLRTSVLLLLLGAVLLTLAAAIEWTLGTLRDLIPNFTTQLGFIPWLILLAGCMVIMGGALKLMVRR